MMLENWMTSLQSKTRSRKRSQQLAAAVIELVGNEFFDNNEQEQGADQIVDEAIAAAAERLNYVSHRRLTF